MVLSIELERVNWDAADLRECKYLVALDEGHIHGICDELCNCALAATGWACDQPDVVMLCRNLVS